MKSKIKYLFPSLLLLGLIGSACKKEDKTESDKFLTGQIKFDMPVYVHKGDVLNLTQGRVYKEDGSSQVGVYWSIPVFKILDTVRVEKDPIEKKGDFDFTVPDTLVNFTVTQVAFASGYFNSSASRTASIVDSTLFTNKGSIKGLRPTLEDFIYQDPRDKREYRCIAIGDLEWFRQNLNYPGTGYAYLDYPELSAMFGRFYNWTQAQTACPENWRLPSEADFANLALSAGSTSYLPGEDYKDCAGNLMANATFNGERLWEFWPSVKIKDGTHFSALPFGYGFRSANGFTFRDMSSYAMFWTSDSYEGKGIVRFIYPDCNDLKWGAFNKEDFAAPVRCVRDKTIKK